MNKNEELAEIISLHREWLQSGNKSGRRADLSGASLKMANLTRTTLAGANLENANLIGATTTAADFSEAYLVGAIWINGEKCKADSIGRCIQ